MDTIAELIDACESALNELLHDTHGKDTYNAQREAAGLDQPGDSRAGSACTAQALYAALSLARREKLTCSCGSAIFESDLTNGKCSCCVADTYNGPEYFDY